MSDKFQLHVSEAAGCLGSNPSRAGMSAIAMRLAQEQASKGAALVLLDVGQSAGTLLAMLKAVSAPSGSRSR